MSGINSLSRLERNLADLQRGWPPGSARASSQQPRQAHSLDEHRAAVIASHPNPRSLTTTESIRLARERQLAEVAGETLAPMAAFEETIAGDMFVKPLVDAIDEVGPEAVLAALERVVRKFAPKANSARRAEQAAVALSQKERAVAALFAPPAQKQEQHELPTVDIRGIDGPNVTARVALALQNQGYAMTSDRLLTLAGRVVAARKVSGA